MAPRSRRAGPNVTACCGPPTRVQATRSAKPSSVRFARSPLPMPAVDWLTAALPGSVGRTALGYLDRSPIEQFGRQEPSCWPYCKTVAGGGR
jgi:hypothetical protein